MENVYFYPNFTNIIPSISSFFGFFFNKLLLKTFNLLKWIVFFHKFLLKIQIRILKAYKFIGLLCWISPIFFNAQLQLFM